MLIFWGGLNPKIPPPKYPFEGPISHKNFTEKLVGNKLSSNSTKGLVLTGGDRAVTLSKQYSGLGLQLNLTPI